MILKNRILILSICIFAGCSSNQTNRWGEEKWDDVTVVKLAGESVPWDKPLYQESDFLFLNDYAIFESDNDDYLLSVYRLSHDSLLFAGSFLYQGRGPSELNAAEKFYFPTEKTLAIVGSNPMGKSIRIPLQQGDNFFDNNTWIRDDYSQWPAIMAYRIFPINDSLYITQPFDEQNSLFALYNIRTGTLKHLNIPYPDNNQTVPLSQRAEAYIGHIRKHPTQQRFVYANSNSKLVTVFDLTNDSIRLVSMPFKQIPEYVASGRDKVRYTANNDNGYQLAVTESRIYCADPKIDRLNREESIARNGYDAGYVQEIYVMDWNGKPISKYILDRPVCYVQPTPDNRYLYAFYTDSSSFESHVIKFEIPQ